MGDGSGSTPGNMFVPIDLLLPILGELLANGRVSGPGSPGSASTPTRSAAASWSAASAGGPAEKAGLERGDIIVGVAGSATKTLGEFYRKLWTLGSAGVSVPLDVQQSGDPAASTCHRPTGWII